MKYINFKRFKFSTIFKNINFRRYNFSKFFKFIDPRRLSFNKVYKYLSFIRVDFNKVYKHINIRRFGFTKFTEYLNPKTYSIDRIKNVDFISSKFLLLHLPVSIIFFGLLYIGIPTFYTYDKSNIENTICKKQNIICSIRGEVNYSFYPTPRIKIKNLIINDFFVKIHSSNTGILISFIKIQSFKIYKFKNFGKIIFFKINIIISF